MRLQRRHNVIFRRRLPATSSPATSLPATSSTASLVFFIFLRPSSPHEEEKIQKTLTKKIVTTKNPAQISLASKPNLSIPAPPVRDDSIPFTPSSPMFLSPAQVLDAATISTPKILGLGSKSRPVSIFAPMIASSTADPEPTMKLVVAKEVADKPAYQGTTAKAVKLVDQKVYINHMCK